MSPKGWAFHRAQQGLARFDHNAAHPQTEEVSAMLVPPIALSFWLFSIPTSGDAQQLMSDMAAERVPLRTVTPEIVHAAETFVTLPMGAERFLTVGGHRYAFVLEPHYHPPGFVGAPNGWHKGVTVYELGPGVIVGPGIVEPGA
jgi:hypothetical protein